MYSISSVCHVSDGSCLWRVSSVWWFMCIASPACVMCLVVHATTSPACVMCLVVHVSSVCHVSDGSCV